MKRLLAGLFLSLWATVASANVPCSVPFNLLNGTTADASQVMANYNALIACLTNAAAAGANNDITALNALTTPLSANSGGTTIYIGGTSGGSANVQTVATVVPSNFTLVTGRSVIFLAGFTNTGAMTLNVNNTGAKSVFVPQPNAPPAATVGGEVQLGQLILAVYDGTEFVQINPSPATPIVVPLTTFGVGPANPDNTAAMNAAIAAANLAGGNISYLVPVGTMNVCAMNVIQVSKVYFVAIGAPETSFFNMTCNAAGVPAFQWSDTTHNVDGGGMLNVGLIGNSNVNQLAISAPWAARLDFINMKVHTVSQLGIWGVANVKATQGVYFGHLHGDFANIAAPVFQLANGSGFYVDAAAVFDATVAGSTVANRHFLSAVSGSWDTIIVSNSTIEVFDTCMQLAPLGSNAVIDIMLVSTWCDSSLRGIIIAPQTSTVSLVTSLQIINSEITSAAGDCIQMSGPGGIFTVNISDNIIRQCFNGGINVGTATALYLNISNNQVYCVNGSNTGSRSGINTSNAVDLTITNNRVFLGAGLCPGNAPAFSYSIQNSNNLELVGNYGNGASTQNFSVTVPASGAICANVGGGVASTGC